MESGFFDATGCGVYGGSGYGGHITNKHQVIPVGVSYDVVKCHHKDCSEGRHEKYELEEWYKKELSTLVEDGVRKVLKSVLKDKLINKYG